MQSIFHQISSRLSTIDLSLEVNPDHLTALSNVDVWATEGVLDLAGREKAEVMVILNRAKSGARVTADVDAALVEMGVKRAETVLGHRVAYADTLGAGKGVLERSKGTWTDEMGRLTDEVLRHLR